MDTLPQVLALFWTSRIHTAGHNGSTPVISSGLKCFSFVGHERSNKKLLFINIYMCVSYLSIGVESNTHAHTPQRDRQTDRQTQRDREREREFNV